MSTLAADVQFDFTFPLLPCEPLTPPSFSFDPSLLEIPPHSGHHGHARNSSHGSAYSMDSSPSDVYSVSTRMTTPARSPVRSHGPLLLPKIRSQDQNLATPATNTTSPAKRRKTSPSPGVTKPYRPAHARSFTTPDFTTASILPSPGVSFTSQIPDDAIAPQLLCSPVSFVQPNEYNLQDDAQARRASSCSLDQSFNYPSYPAMPSYMPISAPSSRASSVTPMPTPQAMVSTNNYLSQQSYAVRAPSPLAAALPITPEPEGMATTTLLSYLSAPNPAPALVNNVAYGMRDQNTKHFWWDVRQIRPWTDFTAASILSLPNASNLLSSPVSEMCLPAMSTAHRHPETENSLFNIYSNFYLPKLNNALRMSSQRPLQLSAPGSSPSQGARASSMPPTTSASTIQEPIFIATNASDPSSAAAMFGGNPSARVVGLVKSFDRFNTGMRVEGNVKKVEYLRGLSHLHRVMREHGCRYGFILTEIELVLVRNGNERTPYFGYLEVASVQLNATGDISSVTGDHEGAPRADEVPLTACLALWGLCMLAADQALPGNVHWRSEIGAPAEGTRRKAAPRDNWMPQPQLAEKRMAKRARGWVWPEDPVGRKELGKRGVKYSGIKC